ncbi:MAG TPA: phosphatase PAP2 family protein [Ramlibacter sp.]|nr:phosphatase PAP2 family protein [Ramlibacter sp.]
MSRIPQRLSLAPASAISLALLALALAWDASGADLPLARLAGSASGFPWREHWLLTEVLHEGARRFAWLLAVGLCRAVWWPVDPLARLPFAARLRLAVSALAGVLAITLLKAASSTSCPWDLAQFGGVAHLVSHWSAQADGGAGRCFPAGHAASGFSFAAGYFAFETEDPPLARAWLATSLGTGLLLGLAQQWRGAHFMSHTLWSAAVCWCTAHAIAAAWPLRREAR